MPARAGARSRLTVVPPRRNARYTPLEAPGPLPWEMVRSVPLIRRDVLAFLEGVVARHGDLVAFPMPRSAVLLVNDPEGARRVLQDNHRGYGKATPQYAGLSAVTGAGLLTAEGDTWLRHRRLMQPAFHHGALTGVAEEAVRAGAHLGRMWDEAGPQQALDADAAVMRAMLPVVGRSLFAVDLAEVGERVVDAVDQALHVVVARASSPLPGGVPSPSRTRLRRAVATLDAVCADVVDRRRAVGVSRQDGDLLALLLRAADEGAMTEAEVRDELVTLVIAGHETVASCLTWTLSLLAAHPTAQACLHQELDEVLPVPSAHPTWTDVPRLAFTRAVVDEALRLYPPAWVITRRALEPDEVCGIRVPSGTLVLLSPWLLHRRAGSWDAPLSFEPRRFIGRPPGPATRAYLPFGGGPRLCIGRDFALVEAVLVLAALLRRRRVVRPPSAPVPRVDALVTLRPRGGLPLLMARR